MGKAKSSFYRFTRGELDPKLVGRSDIDQYFSTAALIQNALTIPQGGLTRRPGLEYLGTTRKLLTQYAAGSITPTAPNGGTAGNIKDNNLATYLLTTTNIGVVDPYVVFQLQLAAPTLVAFVDLELASLTAGTSTEFVIQYGPDGAAWTTVAKTLTLDTTERDYRIPIDTTATYIRLVRIGATDLGTAKAQVAECNVWTEAALQISLSRLIPFQFGDEQDYLFVFTDYNVAIYKDGILQTNAYSPFSSPQLSTINFTSSADTSIFVHKDVAPQMFQRQGAHDLWSFNPITFTNIPKYNFTPVVTQPAQTLTPSAVTGIITLTAGAGTPFAAAVAGEYIDGNGGRARILSQTSGTVVNAIVILPFYNTTAIASGAWDYETGWEAMWSVTRGYPRAVTYYQQRLLFGGFKSLPQTIVASRIGAFFDFDEGSLLDNEAVVFTLESNQSNVIYHLFPHNSLEIFTSGGEFVLLPDKTFSASSIFVRRQSQIGCSPSIRPVEVENGGTLYVQKDGKSVSEFIFSDTTASYDNVRLSLLASHLMNSPVDATLRRSTSAQPANYYLQVNGDGTLVIACMLTAENIIAFTRHTTEGTFDNCVAVGDKMYVCVTRVINGVVKKFIEELKFDRYTDACSYYVVGDLPDPTQVTDLQHLANKIVWMIIDGSVYGKQVVPASGILTLPATVTATLEVGMDFAVAIQTNPVENPQLGPLTGSLKSIPEIFINLYQTSHILVNGYDPFLQQLGTPSTLAAPPNSWTDQFRLQGMLGWDKNGVLNFTQTYPLPMTLLNATINFNFSNK